MLIFVFLYFISSFISYILCKTFPPTVPVYGHLLDDSNQNVNKPFIFYTESLQSLEKNMNKFKTEYKESNDVHNGHAIVYFTNNNHFLISEVDAEPKRQVLNMQNENTHTSFDLFSQGFPKHWVEFYTTDVNQTLDKAGFVVQTLTVVNDESAKGEIAYSRGIANKFTLEYDISTTLFEGLFAVVGGTLGAAFTPEITFAKSASTYYSCPVIRGRTAQIKVFPTTTTLKPLKRKVLWNEAKRKFIPDLDFEKSGKLALIFLTGLEDVECSYI